MNPPPENGSGFTVKEILIRVEQKLDAAVSDHEQRIRSLERWKWSLPLSVIAATTATVIAFVKGGNPPPLP